MFIVGGVEGGDYLLALLEVDAAAVILQALIGVVVQGVVAGQTTARLVQNKVTTAPFLEEKRWEYIIIAV